MGEIRRKFNESYEMMGIQSLAMSGKDSSKLKRGTGNVKSKEEGNF